MAATYKAEYVPHFYYRYTKATQFLWSHRYRLGEAGYPLRADILEHILDEVLAKLPYNFDSGKKGYWRFEFDFNDVIEALKALEGCYIEELEAVRYLKLQYPEDEIFLVKEKAGSDLAKALTEHKAFWATPLDGLPMSCGDGHDENSKENEPDDGYPDRTQLPDHLTVEAYFRECNAKRK